MNKILVPVDFSDAAVSTVRVARKLEAKLSVLHVIHDPANAPGFYESDAAGTREFHRMEEVAHCMMAPTILSLAARFGMRWILARQLNHCRLKLQQP